MFFVFFLDSVNRSLNNDCFWAISCCVKALCFLFVNRNFQCSFSEWDVRYLKETKMVNAKGSNGHYRPWCKDKNFCQTVSKSLGF